MVNGTALKYITEKFKTEYVNAGYSTKTIEEPELLSRQVIAFKNDVNTPIVKLHILQETQRPNPIFYSVLIDVFVAPHASDSLKDIKGRKVGSVRFEENRLSQKSFDKAMDFLLEAFAQYNSYNPVPDNMEAINLEI